MKVCGFSLCSGSWLNFFRLGFLVSASILGGIGCVTSPPGGEAINEDFAKKNASNAGKTGVSVTVGLGAPGNNYYFRRISVTAEIKVKGNPYATLELVRDTTEGNERGEFYFSRADRSGTPGDFSGLTEASQVGRVTYRTDAQTSGMRKKYVNIRSSLAFLGDLVATADSHVPFLTEDEGKKNTGLDDFLSKADEGSEGVQSSNGLKVVRYASHLGDDPSWSAICSTPSVHDVRLCTLRGYKSNVGAGKPDSFFLGDIMCGNGEDRRHLSLSMSFASGDKIAVKPNDKSQPILLNVSGLDTIEVKIPDALADGKEGTFFGGFKSLSEPPAAEGCGSCRTSFAYEKKQILKDPFLAQIRNVYKGDEIVDWLLDGVDPL